MNRVNTRLMGIWLGCVIVMASYGVQAADQSEIENLLTTKMNAIRQQQPDPTSDAVIAKKYGVKLLPYLEQYRKDTSDRVRWRAHALLWLVGEKSESTSDRQNIVEMLVEALEDKEPLMWQAVSGWLLSFKADDFSPGSKGLLHKHLTTKKPPNQIVLICGVADMKSELPRLQKFLIDESKVKPETGQGYWWGTLSWAARRARARMGVEEYIERCIQLVNSEPDLTRRLTHLIRKDLQYIRQPRVVDVLRKYLDSDQKLPPLLPRGMEGKKPEIEDRYSIPYAQYAAAALAEILVGFPVKKHAGGYSDEEINLCRQWMREQTKWDIIR